MIFSIKQHVRSAWPAVLIALCLSVGLLPGFHGGLVSAAYAQEERAVPVEEAAQKEQAANDREAAQADHAAPDFELGDIHFPTSGSAEAQPHFRRGVLLLHSFEYDRAAEAFREAQRLDPDFAMAYWGEAMTYNHPLWDQQDREAARAALERLAPTAEGRLAEAPTAREKAYLRALEILYGEGTKERRDTLYSEHMEQMAAQFPEDTEARAFHALSILGLSQGERSHPTYMRGGAIALDIFRDNPQHPGAMHYAIHSFDDPVHAPLGLPAARAYSQIVPNAAHAQHMVSHIFVALGMWDDVVTANEKATRAEARMSDVAEGSGRSRWPCGHNAKWLVYGYLQQGRVNAAEEVLGECRDVMREHPDWMSPRSSVAAMRAMMAVAPDSPTEKASADQTADAAPMDSDGSEAADIADAAAPRDTARASGTITAAAADTIAAPVDNANAATVDTTDFWLLAKDDFLFADGLYALRSGQPELAKSSLEQMTALRERAAADRPPAEPLPSSIVRAEIMERVLEARILIEQGNEQAAIETLQWAVDLQERLPVPYGPPPVRKPPLEALGEVLLEADRPADAANVFGRALERTPRRAQSLLGLARAYAASNQPEKAAETYRRLSEVWDAADNSMPAYQDVQRYLQQIAATP